MQLVIEDETLVAARMSPEELKLELAITLYARERLTLGQAAHLAGIGQWQFQQALAGRGVAVHYDEAELKADQAQLKRHGWR